MKNKGNAFDESRDDKDSRDIGADKFSNLPPFQSPVSLIRSHAVSPSLPRQIRNDGLPVLPPVFDKDLVVELTSDKTTGDEEIVNIGFVSIRFALRC